jgi:hypothetical protein
MDDTTSTLVVRCIGRSVVVVRRSREFLTTIFSHSSTLFTTLITDKHSRRKQITFSKRLVDIKFLKD